MKKLINYRLGPFRLVTLIAIVLILIYNLYEVV